MYLDRDAKMPYGGVEFDFDYTIEFVDFEFYDIIFNDMRCFTGEFVRAENK